MESFHIKKETNHSALGMQTALAHCLQHSPVILNESSAWTPATAKMCMEKRCPLISMSMGQEPGCDKL